MPRAMIRMAMNAKPGLFRNSLSANFKFCIIAIIFAPLSGVEVAIFGPDVRGGKELEINACWDGRRWAVSVVGIACPVVDMGRGCLVKEEELRVRAFGTATQG